MLIRTVRAALLAAAALLVWTMALWGQALSGQSDPSCEGAMVRGCEGSGAKKVRTIAPLQSGRALPGRSVPRTPWGDPDLQGIWPSGSLNTVPFERPVAFGTRAELTEAEFAERAAAVQRQSDADAAEFSSQSRASTQAPSAAPAPVTPPSHWLETGRASRQASLIVDPPDGRLPRMTEDGARRARQWPSLNPPEGHASAQEFNIYDRCITRGVLGSTMPNIYGSGIEIMQTPGFVVLRYEMIHETRIVPLDGRPHLPASMRSYMGDSRGRWEGDTLVVDTVNLNGRTGSLARNGNGNPLSESARLVERFTRRGPDTLDYSVIVDDPATWTRPWAVAFPLTRDPAYTMYEYACHEGNYAIANMLRAFRAAGK